MQAQRPNNSSGDPNATPPASSGQYSFPVPAGLDPTDPTTAFVLGQFQKYYGASDPGSQPTLSNLQYWINTINSNGGVNSASTQTYWTQKMTPGSGGAGGSGGSSGAPGANPSGFTNNAPQYGSFTSSPQPYVVPPPLNPTQVSAGTPYVAPTFTPPTGLNYTNDPGYQARMTMGTDAIQASAAAQGSVLSGGTLKALDQYAQDYASNEYQNVYGRALSTFNANTAAGQYANSANQQASQWAQGTNVADQIQAYQTNLGAGQFGYTTNVATQRNAQIDYYTRLLAYYNSPNAIV